jgi:hypothetical protein
MKSDRRKQRLKRLEEELRSNLAKRKSLTRARSAQSQQQVEPPTPPGTPVDGDNGPHEA